MKILTILLSLIIVFLFNCKEKSETHPEPEKSPEVKTNSPAEAPVENFKEKFKEMEFREDAVMSIIVKKKGSNSIECEELGSSKDITKCEIVTQPTISDSGIEFKISNQNCDLDLKNCEEKTIFLCGASADDLFYKEAQEPRILCEPLD